MPKVAGALAGLPGIIEAEAFYPEKEARAVYDPELIGVEGIVKGLSQAGYCAAPQEPQDPPPIFPIMENQEAPAFQPDELVCYLFRIF
jgi:hypothetical protein